MNNSMIVTNRNFHAATSWQRQSKMAIDAMTYADWKYSIDQFPSKLKKLAKSLECDLSVVQAKKKELGL